MKASCFKSIMSVVVVVLLSTSVYGQENYPPTLIEEVGSLSCIYNRKYTVKERKQLYPFSSAQVVKLISFRYNYKNLPVDGDKLDEDSLIEVKKLKAADINVLTDILYNNFFAEKANFGVITQCFFPRNAILFFDKKNELFDYILICFQCDRYESRSEKIIFDGCTEKVEKLRLFFVKHGLTFGTDESIESYPGELHKGEGL